VVGLTKKAPFQAPPSRILKLNWLIGEPRRTQTSNRLIKRDNESMLLDASIGNLVSAGQKLSLGYYLTYYLVPYSVGKFVGKMLAKILILTESVNRRKTGIQ